MRVALDVDGVEANFADPCNHWLASYLGQEPAPIDRWDWFNNYHAKGIYTPAEAWREFWLMVKNSGGDWLSMAVPVIPGAQQGVSALRHAGHEVSYLTARNKDYFWPTANWLARHGFIDPLSRGDGLYMGRDKHLPEFEFDLLVDDRPENVTACLLNGRRAVLFDQPWNRHARGLRRVEGWDQLVQYVKALSERLVNA